MREYKAQKKRGKIEDIKKNRKQLPYQRKVGKQDKEEKREKRNAREKRRKTRDTGR